MFNQTRPNVVHEKILCRKKPFFYLWSFYLLTDACKVWTLLAVTSTHFPNRIKAQASSFPKINKTKNQEKKEENVWKSVLWQSTNSELKQWRRASSRIWRPQLLCYWPCSFQPCRHFSLWCFRYALLFFKYLISGFSPISIFFLEFVDIVLLVSLWCILVFLDWGMLYFVLFLQYIPFIYLFTISPIPSCSS